DLVIEASAVVLQVQLAQVSQRNGCVRAPHAEVAGGSISAFPSKVPERSNADGPRVLRHTYSDGLEAVCIVLPRFISGSYPLSVHYLKCDVRPIPRRPYGHESTVVGKVRTRISHANSVRLVVLVLQSQFAFEERIGNLELAREHTYAAAANVSELHVRIFKAGYLASL